MRYNGKYAKPSVRPPLRLGSLMMRIAAVLLCLVMVSVHLMSGMYAKYTTNGSGTDDARVAKFDVEINGSADVTVDCKTGDNGTYEITVNNKSEVAVSYTISVTTAVAKDSLNFDKSAVTAELDTDKGALPVSGSGTHILTFTVNDWSKITKNMTGENGLVSLNFTVTIDVVQVD